MSSLSLNQVKTGQVIYNHQPIFFPLEIHGKNDRHPYQRTSCNAFPSPSPSICLSTELAAYQLVSKLQQALGRKALAVCAFMDIQSAGIQGDLLLPRGLPSHYYSSKGVPLSITLKWCSEHNLSVNPNKTVLVPFHRRQNLVLPPIQMRGEALAYSNMTKYLECWGNNILKRYPSHGKIIKLIDNYDMIFLSLTSWPRWRTSVRTKVRTSQSPITIGSSITPRPFNLTKHQPTGTQTTPRLSRGPALVSMVPNQNINRCQQLRLRISDRSSRDQQMRGTTH